MMAGINLFEDILLKQFRRLPSWARTTAYFLILFLFIYLTLLPTFISGECFIKDKDGALIPFRGGLINFNVAGQTLKVRIHEDGVWSLPMVSKLPQNLTVYFQYDNKYYPVVIKSTSLWMPGTQRVYFEDNPRRFYLAEGEKVSILDRVTAKLISVLGHIASPAYAQTTPHKAKKGKKETAGEDSLTILVRNATAGSLGVDTASVKGESFFRKQLAPSAVQRIRLVRDIEKRFNIKISDEEWDTLYTIKDIAKFILMKPKETKSR
jgi:acyl carrier protein